MPDTLPEVTWKVHRARETPLRTAAVSVFVLAFIVYVGVSFSWLMAFLSLVVIFVATHTYFLPIEYTLSSRGVEVDKLIFDYTYEWNRFRRWFRTSGGVVLSPFSEGSWLDNFRGVHLLLPNDDAAVVAYLTQRFARQPEDGQCDPPMPES